MPDVFHTTAWHSAIADLVAAGDEHEISTALIEAIGVAADNEGTCLIAFRRDASPEVLRHTLEPAGAEHYLERYLAGPYLLDPLYQLAMQDSPPRVCRFRDELPDRFRSSEYYRQYCERTHLLDEIDFFAKVGDGTTLVFVVGRRTRTFSKVELGRLEIFEPTVQVVLQNIWQARKPEADRAVRGDAMHDKLTRCFEHFGEDVLTERERQISQLLLRGYSSKSAARELQIAPGTVMVHKRNLFSKLGISSQYGLFSLLIKQLEKS
jgi:DNA-binding CsgD family transcriptional regulator